MRLWGMVGFAVVAGCSNGAVDAPGDRYEPVTVDEDWSEAPLTYLGRFGGSFEMGSSDEEVDGSVEGTGEEYTVITGPEGELVCDWRWTTNTAQSADLGDCVGCVDAWDVTCFDGHESAGDCAGWMDPSADVGPMQFYMTFEPAETIDGVQHGTVYVRASLYDKWRPYADGTWDGQRVAYEFTYEWF